MTNKPFAELSKELLEAAERELAQALIDLDEANREVARAVVVQGERSQRVAKLRQIIADHVALDAPATQIVAVEGIPSAEAFGNPRVNYVLKCERGEYHLEGNDVQLVIQDAHHKHTAESPTLERQVSIAAKGGINTSGEVERAGDKTVAISGVEATGSAGTLTSEINLELADRLNEMISGPVRFTDKVARTVEAGGDEPYTASKIRDSLERQGVDLRSRFKNPVAAIHTVLGRLAKAKKIIEVNAQLEAKAYMWNSIDARMKAWQNGWLPPPTVTVHPPTVRVGVAPKPAGVSGVKRRQRKNKR